MYIAQVSVMISNQPHAILVFNRSTSINSEQKETVMIKVARSIQFDKEYN